MFGKPLFKKMLLCFVFLIFGISSVDAQYSSINVNKKKLSYTDSIKAIKYDYVFPIWGQKVYEKGFDIPYPIGAMVNYMWMDQNLDFSNFQLGFKSDSKDIPLTPIDFIQFKDNANVSSLVNFRPDIWVFPFLNVYGLFGKGVSETTVNVVAPINLQSIVEQEISTKGFGVMAAGGVGKFWFSVDGNWSWSKPELLDKAVQTKVMGIRFGNTVRFKNKPQSNLAYWIGGMRITMAADTSGEILLKDALPPDVWDRKDAVVADYYDWYDNEATAPQKVIADQVLTPIIESIDARDGSSTIRYAMDKQVAQKWNVLFGGQYQLNKKWMLRSEAGLIGNRKSFLLSVNYRFRL